MFPWILLTTLSLLALLVGEKRRDQRLKALAKPLASAGFLGAAIAAGALASPYGRTVLAALALSWVGDVFLLSPRPRPFLAGLVAFLLAHLAFATAFAIRGPDAAWTAATLGVLALPAAAVLRRLWPYLGASMRPPVLAYVAVISLMLALAAGAFAAGGPASLPIGASAFYLSDLSVARDRFVSAGFVNRAWGLPLYYFAQLCLASSVQV